jgi:hypothetical protein
MWRAINYFFREHYVVRRYNQCGNGGVLLLLGVALGAGAAQVVGPVKSPIISGTLLLVIGAYCATRMVFGR